MKKAYISSEETKLPFSEAVEANGFVFISGQVHSDPEGNLVGETIEEKTHQTMKNVGMVLSAAGLSFADVLKMEIFLPDLSERAKVSEVYESYLTHPYPARAMIGVAELPMGASIEITAVAVRKSDSN
jgi:2-iminobutanoate/2-iminopropanoate deaminase